MKKIYLFGGLGNNLFQIQKGLDSGEDVVYITNIIVSKRINKLFGWTYHSPHILNAEIVNDINFKEEKWLIVFQDLILVAISRKLGINVFGVSWESSALNKTNFGYFQNIRTTLPTLELKSTVVSCSSDHDIPLVHIRLGDSPTLMDDLYAQLKLISSLGFPEIRIVTNSPKDVLGHVVDLDVDFKIVGGDVLSDFYLLSLARTVIIPQSTFSLFASLINSNIKKLYLRKSALEIVSLTDSNIDYRVY